MPRSRKPIRTQTGNLTVLQQQERMQEEKIITVGNDQLKRPPRWLVNEIAKKEYKRLIKELEKIEIIGNLDLNNIAAYCNAYSDYISTTELLRSEDKLISRETRTGTMLIRNPLIDIQRVYADEMRKFAALCGLTIDSRLKAAATRISETENEINGKFGNI